MLFGCSGFPATADVCTGQNLQYRVITGGNPNLNPENSESFYYETSYQPKFIKGLTVTLGYTHLDVKNVITAPNPATIVAQPNLYPPGSVVRDTAHPAFPGDPGEILSINSILVNVSEEKEDAIDLGIEYVKETETIGTFTGNLLANYTPNFQLAGESGGFSQQSGQGSFGPAGKGNVGVVWRGPKASWSEKFSFGPTFNYWSAYHDVLLPSRVVGDWWTVDLQATYELPWETTLTVGMLNVADRDAPRSLGQNGEGYDNTVADNRGRFTYFRVNKKF